MTHMYFSESAKGRISYGHLGRTSLLIKMFRCSVVYIHYIQDYIRDQPDNITSVKLVTETVAVLDALYMNINSDNVQTVSHIFNTLNEFASGNRATCCELVDCKVIDYINVILRIHQQIDCPVAQVSQCHRCILTHCVWA